MAENIITQIPNDKATLYRFPSGLLEFEIQGYVINYQDYDPETKTTTVTSAYDIRAYLGSSLFNVEIISADKDWIPTGVPGQKKKGYRWRIKIATAEIGNLTLAVRWKQIVGPAGNQREENFQDVRQVNVIIDTFPPEIIGPAQNLGDLGVPDLGAIIELRFLARDDQTGVRSVNCIFEGQQIPLQPIANGWLARVPVSALPIDQNREIIVKAVDNAGNESLMSYIFKAKDITPPHSSIRDLTRGKDFINGDTFARDDDTPIIVGGRASDSQSGMTGGASKVEWSLDGKPFQSAIIEPVILPNGNPSPNDINWKVSLTRAVYASFGAHTLRFNFVDRDNNLITIARDFQIISSYKPKNLEQRLSTVEYLRDLLRFIRDYVKTSNDTTVSTPQLESVFYQPFGALSEPLSDAGNQVVSSLRIAIEALISSKQLNETQIADVQQDYLQNAYEALLSGLGTSYSELRLIRSSDKPTRENLARRLGIRLTVTTSNVPDELEQLLLEPSELNSNNLEQYYGLANPFSSSLPQSKTETAQLLNWQLRNLAENWMEQDHPSDITEKLLPVIIDPDLISENDIKDDAKPEVKPIIELRKEELATYFKKVKKIHADHAAEPQLSTFNLLNREISADWDLDRLVELDGKGANIDTELDKYHLTRESFLYLIQVKRLAQNELVNSEWENVFHILTQIEKKKNYETWREKETGILLSPRYFKISTAQWNSFPFRGTALDRQNWLDILQSRIDQEQSLIQAFSTNIAYAEGITLPKLRDALIQTISDGRNTRIVADELTKDLLVDLNVSGSLQTTRVQQAIETLQNMIFTLRAGDFPQQHPADDWKLPIDKSAFDDEWRWMGSYDLWQAAIRGFLFPENGLFPSLFKKGPSITEGGISKYPFQELLDKLRLKRRITVTDARSYTNDFLISAKKTPTPLPSGFTFEKESNELLKNIRVFQQPLIKQDPASEVDKWLLMLFYFVPMQVALQLQKSGEYLGALDFYKRIYAYHLPLNERKVFGFLGESNTSANLDRNPNWATRWLDPHTFVQGRPNPYTRYTLLAIARCFLEYADDEFSRDTGQSVANARSLYFLAHDMLSLPDLELIAAVNENGEVAFVNPQLEAMRLHTENQLEKLRQGRNIAGLKRTLTILSADSGRNFSSDKSLHPTPYYYRVLIERSKQLVNIAQQIETQYLSALEKFDQQGARIFQEGQRLDTARENIELQTRRKVEADESRSLADRQKVRTDFLKQEYDRRINAGLNVFENKMLENYIEMRNLKNDIAGLDAAIGAAQFSASAASILDVIGGFGSKQIIAGIGAAAFTAKGIVTGFVNAAEASLQANSMYASHERRIEEWRLQKGVAEQDGLIADQQIQIAEAHVEIVAQEKRIAEVEHDHAQAMINFLNAQFTNQELYEFIIRVLAGVYGYFLQQATAIAKLAQNQLAFERQAIPPQFIQADYWQIPSETENKTTNSNDGQATDRRGLTGSARLLQDIYQLDQFAFETDQRKLNLTQTFSLSQLAPFEFQQFRETGILPFATPMQLFDRAFPGHYLRLIRRVRTSVMALIPPNQGIRATLISSGISRVVIGGDIFQKAVIHRPPELIALTSPVAATGVFELDVQSEMLLPFEAMGVDTSWELQLPKAANFFDFSTIADVLFTIEYTALNSFDFRQQIINQLDRKISSDLTISFSQQYADLWYDLNNPEQRDIQQQMVVKFKTKRSDFPPNVENLKTQQLVLFFARKNGSSFEIPVTHLHFMEEGSNQYIGGEATSIDGIISTRRGNASSLQPMIGKTPVGEWELKLPNTVEMVSLFRNEDIKDILFIITYSSRTSEWLA